MSTVHNPTDGERLVRVQLSCATEPGDRRVNGLVDELGASRSSATSKPRPRSSLTGDSPSATTSPTSTPDRS